MRFRRACAFLKASGVPVVNSTTRPTASDALLDELEQFVAGRLLLILLPVRQHLKRRGQTPAADVALEISTRDIRHNIAKILASHGDSK